MVSKPAAFFERYPDIAVEFGTSESPASLIEDGFDLAIHSGDLPDSSLVARRFAQTLTILVATPQFVTRHRLPQSIDELRSLPAIPFVQSGTVQPWEFSSAQRITPSAFFAPGILNSYVSACSNTWGSPRPRRGSSPQICGRVQCSGF
jgi:DNA-binding transcriptional LysR family regulator